MLLRSSISVIVRYLKIVLRDMASVIIFTFIFNFYCLIGITYCYFNFPVSSYRSLEKNTHGQSDKIVSLSKWRILNRLHDRNETLYYRVSLMMKLGCYLRKYGNIYFQMVLMLLPFILFRHLLIISKNLLQ